jgi:hypothetical protein
MRRVVISLSTIPSRFSALDATLQRLLAQTHPAEQILLYIPHRYRRFPDWDGRLPRVPEGVEIRRSEDWGPATKVLAAAKDFAGEPVEIVFCDDDRLYSKRLVSGFLRTRAKRPDAVIANLGFNHEYEPFLESNGAGRPQPSAVRFWRATDIEFQLRLLLRQIKARRRDVQTPFRRVYKIGGYVDIFEGCGGAMVRPEFFDADFYEIPPVLWSVDDFWLSGMFRAKGIGIWLRGNRSEPPLTSADTADPLWDAVIDGVGRFEANVQAGRYFQDTFGIWK